MVSFTALVTSLEEGFHSSVGPVSSLFCFQEHYLNFLTHIHLFCPTEKFNNKE